MLNLNLNLKLDLIIIQNNLKRNIDETALFTAVILLAS
jgi:hypothetical protein